MENMYLGMRPRFLLWLLVILVFALLFGGVPSERKKAKAKLILTRVETKLMTELLAEQAVKIGGLSNRANEFVLNSLRAAHDNQYLITRRTNSSREVVDVWQTPFQIKLIGRTNFSISSAGPNRRFGDKDDIIFDGLKNDFVKP